MYLPRLRRCNLICSFVFLLMCFSISAQGEEAKKSSNRPNFLFILIDDLGWNDVSYNGSTFHETPHLDKFAAENMRFDYSYAASPMCSPTRASILTGKHPVRHGITQYIPGWRSSKVRSAKRTFGRRSARATRVLDADSEIIVVPCVSCLGTVYRKNAQRASGIWGVSH